MNDATIGSLLGELMSHRNFQVTITNNGNQGYSIETAYLRDAGSDYQDGFVTLQEALEYGVKVIREYDETR